MKTTRLSIILILLTAMFIRVNAQTEVNIAKATFLYNFTRFVEWPSKTNSNNFVITVFGSSELYNELSDYTINKYVSNQHIIVKLAYSVEDIKNCDLLFVSFSKASKLKEISAFLSNSNTLIVSEKPGSLEDGAAINFVTNEDKLSYEIKPANATKAGLKLSSLILKYAKNNNSFVSANTN